MTEFLFVGEGDFSFSYSVTQQLLDPKEGSLSPKVIEFMGNCSEAQLKNSKYIASSYDTESDLTAKYPEIGSYFDSMRSNPRVSLEHNVNAWKLSDSFPEKKFTGIIWNHPHLGLEDCLQHSRLLAHFYHSAQAVLAEGGFIQISLLGGQIPRWKAVEMATKNGLTLSDAFPLDTSAFPPFVCKRNERAATFKNSHVARHHLGHLSRTDVDSAASHGGLDSFVLRFTVGTETHQAVHNRLAALLAAAAEKNAPKGAPVEEKVRDVDIEFARQWKLNSRTGKRESKADMLKRLDGVTSFRCLHCARPFNCERSASTHILNTHSNCKPGEVLSSAAANAAAPKKEKPDWQAVRLAASVQTITCALCGKECADEDALTQHMTAKHGDDSQIEFKAHLIRDTSAPADTAEEGEGEDSEGAAKRAKMETVECTICGLVCSPRSMEQHLDNLVPSVALELPCECGKKFKDQRALRQHANFCDVYIKAKLAQAKNASAASAATEVTAEVVEQNVVEESAVVTVEAPVAAPVVPAPEPASTPVPAPAAAEGAPATPAAPAAVPAAANGEDAPVACPDDPTCRLVDIVFARQWKLNSRTGKRESKAESAKRLQNFTSFKCLHCSKNFELERDASTHILNTHPLCKPGEILPMSKRAARKIQEQKTGANTSEPDAN